MATRVLFAIPALDRAGPEAVFYRLLAHLDREVIEPHLAVNRRDGEYLRRLAGTVPVHHVGAEGNRYPVGALASTVRRTRPDVVLATLNMTLTAGAAAPAFPRSTRLVLRQANHVSLSNRDASAGSRLKAAAVAAAYRATFHQADLVISQSRAMATDVREAGLVRRGHVVLPNPVDVDAVAAEATPVVELPGTINLVSVGRLASQKGYDLLLRALSALSHDLPGLHLTIVGDGPQRAELEVLAADLGVAGAVSFAGFREDPYCFVAAADLVVSSSRYEGFANTTLEALALGRPVVGTDGPGANDEMVVPGVNGELVPPGDVEALESGIRLALDRMDRYDAATIVADVRERFGVRSVAERYAEALSSL